jgi:hypothetical protein
MKNSLFLKNRQNAVALARNLHCVPVMAERSHRPIRASWIEVCWRFLAVMRMSVRIAA